MVRYFLPALLGAILPFAVCAGGDPSNSNSLESILSAISLNQGKPLPNTTAMDTRRAQNDDIGAVVTAVEIERRQNTRPPSPSVVNSPATSVVAPKVAAQPPAQQRNTVDAHVIATPTTRDPFDAEIREVIAIMNPNARNHASFANEDVVSIANGKNKSQPIADLDTESAAPLTKVSSRTNTLIPNAQASKPNRVYAYGPTKPGSTLGQIAEHLLPSDQVSVAQMMWALYVKNPKAFVNKDIRTLRANYILNVPEANEIAAIARDEAEKQISRLRAAAKSKGGSIL